MLALVARILVSSNVVPGPTVEASVLNVGNVIGREIIAEFVALINGGPEFAGLWVDGNTYCIADTPRVNARAGSIGVRLQDVRPVKFNGIVVGIVDVRLGSARYVNLLTSQRKHNVARPVSPSAQQPAAREIGHNHFPRTAGLQVSVLVWEANDGVGIRKKKRIWGWPLGDRRQCQKAP